MILLKPRENLPDLLIAGTYSDLLFTNAHESWSACARHVLPKRRSR